MNPLTLIDKYYAGIPALREVLLTHSRQVADRALAIVDAHPEWVASGEVDRQFVEEAAMLHDIGIIFCNAPKIHCTGSHSYIEHGYLGAELLPAQARLSRRATYRQRHHRGAGGARKHTHPLARLLPAVLGGENHLLCR